jgi:iron-sulfur cluster assembly accessory protein
MSTILLEIRPMTVSITLSPEAITQALCLKKDQPQDAVLRLYLEGKGCDGFYYGVSFDSKTPEDQIFLQAGDDGQSVELAVDTESLKFVSGSQVIWVDDERGRGFLVENPRHKKFRGKFYKRAGWQERL